jgi:NADPH:quinone reductase-like Zn-dependent oxidoreductase
MGHDFAGVVEAVGAGVTRLETGDAVLGGARFRQAGAFAEMVTAPEKAVVLKPVVGFGFDPAALAGRFDLVLDTPGMLPFAAARTLLKPGGTIVDIVPTPAKMIRSALPGPFRVMMGRPVTADLEEVARTRRLPIARTVELAGAIPALTVTPTSSADARSAPSGEDADLDVLEGHSEGALLRGRIADQAEVENAAGQVLRVR